jgi:hypothetical protein
MSRKPAILELAGGKSQRQRAWEAIRGLAGINDGTFTAADISRCSKVEIDPVREYLKGLSAGGYVCIINPDASRAGGRSVKNVFELMRDNGVEAPRVRRDGTEVTQGRGTEAMWAAMTALDSFNYWLIAELAQVKPGTACSYCLALGKAGYLDILTVGKGIGKGGIATVWTVSSLHRMKPRAPMITRLKAIYDPNIHQIVWAEGADAAADAIEVGEVL